MKKTISFKQALKKQWQVFAIGLLLVIAMGWRLSPLDTPSKLLYFCGEVVLLGVGLIIFVRRYTNQVLCNNCKANIYTVIEHCNHEKIIIKYCPSCGTEIGT